MSEARRLLSRTSWSIKAEEVDRLCSEVKSVVLQPMRSGLEASVHKLSLGDASYVLKVWDKSSKPDIAYQYRLLKQLSDNGVAVSKPFGVGVNDKGCPMLLTSYDGVPIAKLNKDGHAKIAELMAAIHMCPHGETAEWNIRKHDFVDYFYPGISDCPDLREWLLQFLAMAEPTQGRIIHGDLHLGNLVESDGRIVAIDWTNGQLGDPRYDLMWAMVITRIYVSDRHAGGIKSAYFAHKTYTEQELLLFEAIAFLRWLLLLRQGYVPVAPSTKKKADGIISNNRYLQNKNLFPPRA
ncbi:MAG: aminoglycoside phosphotransferase family protein [Cohnella sp.]|nr:aminoglycoside phosphotransferase family protein [Cohnella sp.]